MYKKVDDALLLLYIDNQAFKDMLNIGGKH